jgi:hypothetical protein
MFTKSSTDRVLPKRLIPKTLIVEDSRMKLRNE